MAISCWVHCRLRIFREGGGRVHAGFIVGCCSVRVRWRVYTAFRLRGREGGGEAAFAGCVGREGHGVGGFMLPSLEAEVV